MEFFVLIQLLLFLLFGSLNCQEDSAHRDEIIEMPGATFPINFKQYSGFLQVSPTRYYHYWFMESQSKPATDPVMLTMTSGYGYSTLMLSSWPFYTNPGGQTLRPNPYGANKNISVLNIDGPVGIGFSYADDGNYYSDDNLVIVEYYAALKQFYKRFPGFRTNPFFVSGRSYGGMYAPLMSMKIIDGLGDYPINFKGMVITNGAISVVNFISSMVEYGYMHGQVDEKWWGMIQANCCDTNTNDYVCWDGIMENEEKVLEDGETCGLKIWNMYMSLWNSGVDPYDISSRCPNKTTATTNFVDKNYNMPIGIDKTEEMCRFVSKSILKRYANHLVDYKRSDSKNWKNGGINKNSFKASSIHHAGGFKTSIHHSAKQHHTQGNAENATSSNENSKTNCWDGSCNFMKNILTGIKSSKKNHTNKIMDESLAVSSEKFIPFDTCDPYTANEIYMNRVDVQKALHIPADFGKYSFVPTKGDTVLFTSFWNSNISYGGWLYDDMKEQIKSVVLAKYPVLLYYGDQDMYVNFLHAQRMPERIELNLTSAKQPWKFEGQTGGFKTIYANGGLTTLTVRFAGRNVPADSPAFNQYILSQFLHGKSI